MCPVIKTEYIYEDSSDDCPQVITKEAPYTATELAKLRKDFSRMAKESETEYMWRVSLTGGDGILLSEKEAEGYWGPGVFITTGNHQAPWSLTESCVLGWKAEPHGKGRSPCHNRHGGSVSGKCAKGGIYPDDV